MRITEYHNGNFVDISSTIEKVNIINCSKLEHSGFLSKRIMGFCKVKIAMETQHDMILIHFIHEMYPILFVFSDNSIMVLHTGHTFVENLVNSTKW